MPIYRYECQECERSFSERRSSDERDAEAVCPECGSSETDRAMSRFAVGKSNTPAPPPSCNPSACAGGSCPFS